MGSNNVYRPFVPGLKWFMKRAGELDPDRAWHRLSGPVYTPDEVAAGYAEATRRSAVSGDFLVGVTERQLKDAVALLLKSPLGMGCSIRWRLEDGLLVRACAMLDYGVMNGTAGHVFLPDGEFASWLVGCVDPENLKPDMFGALFSALPKRPAHADYVLHRDYCEKIGVIHIPGRAPFAFGRTRERPDEKSMLVNMSFSMGEPTWGLIPYKYTTSKMSAEHGIEDLADLRRLQWPEWHLRLLAGLSLYMDCFPEQVKPGVPSRGNTGEFDVSRSLTLGVSPKVRASASGASGGGHSSPTGHYRSGAFMRLTSPRYVKMRGQTIFRHGCFVNGKALTVDGV